MTVLLYAMLYAGLLGAPLTAWLVERARLRRDRARRAAALARLDRLARGELPPEGT